MGTARHALGAFALALTLILSGCAGDTTHPATPSATTSPSPTATAEDASVAVSTGPHHTCALRVGEGVLCWGANDWGQLGDGTTTASASPVKVTGVENATAVVAGFDYSCALLAAGTVKCWGTNVHGELGLGASSDSPNPLPREVTGLSHVSSISATPWILGGAAVSGKTCVIADAGSVACWGAYVAPGLVEVNGSTAPTPVPGVTSATSISVADKVTCVVLADGSARCWGDNIYGQLGDGTTTTSATPVQVAGLAHALAISASDWHTCALLASHRVTCWGANWAGQLGNGTTTNSLSPVEVTSLTDATFVVASSTYSCAIVTEGNLACWGSNDLPSQGGPLSTNIVTTPQRITGVTAATTASINFDRTCAGTLPRNVTCWGVTANAAGGREPFSQTFTLP
jgi:alpha-tubulin suppressor-like RCC1 family protein